MTSKQLTIVTALMGRYKVREMVGLVRGIEWACLVFEEGHGHVNVFPDGRAEYYEPCDGFLQRVHTSYWKNRDC